MREQGNLPRTDVELVTEYTVIYLTNPGSYAANHQYGEVNSSHSKARVVPTALPPLLQLAQPLPTPLPATQDFGISQVVPSHGSGSVGGMTGRDGKSTVARRGTKSCDLAVYTGSRRSLPEAPHQSY